MYERSLVRHSYLSDFFGNEIPPPSKDVVRHVLACQQGNFVTSPIFQVVDHEHVNPADYYTISSTGVTRVRDSEIEYTSLGAWEKEYRDYQILIKIKTFANFRIWKAFAVWRKNVRTKKIVQCRNDLKDNLFIVNDVSRILKSSQIALFTLFGTSLEIS